MPNAGEWEWIWQVEFRISFFLCRLLVGFFALIPSQYALFGRCCRNIYRAYNNNNNNSKIHLKIQTFYVCIVQKEESNHSNIFKDLCKWIKYFIFWRSFCLWSSDVSVESGTKQWFIFIASYTIYGSHFNSRRRLWFKIYKVYEFSFRILTRVDFFSFYHF